MMLMARRSHVLVLAILSAVPLGAQDVSSMLPKKAGGPTVTVSGGVLTAETPQLILMAGLDEQPVAPGQKLSIVVDVAPRRGMHVYAPGKHTYKVARLTLQSQPWLRVHPPTYPPSQIYRFAPLDERVE